MTQQPTLEEIEWAIAPLLEENARLREQAYHGRNQLRDSDSKIAALEARVKELEERLATIARRLAPGMRTYDECMYDMGIACDLARAIAQAEKPSE